MIPLCPPGAYDITYAELVALGGVPAIPKRPHIRKLRIYNPTSLQFAYPWILSDDRDGLDLWACKTWDEAYAKAWEWTRSVPKPIRLRELRESDRYAMYRIFNAHGVTFGNGTGK
jgi:hypothetical protein